MEQQISVILFEILMSLSDEHNENACFLIFVTLFGILIFNFTMITILCSLYKAYKEIYDDRVYVLEGEGIFITCKIYLTYSDYYLIISNGEEKFISKNKIEIIRKIKIPNEHK